MIMTVEDLRKNIETQLSDEVLEAKLQALEMAVRSYTNNNFQNRNIRFRCPVVNGKLSCSTPLLNPGDTIQISDSVFNDGIYAIREVEEGFMKLDREAVDEDAVLITKVVYPADVAAGVINMMRWDLENRDKVGIQQETISRHSVTYFNMDGENSSMGYPKSLLGFLNPYKKAYF